MLANRTAPARHKVLDGSLVRSSCHQAPRAAWFCRLGSPWSIGFALLTLMLAGIPPAARGPFSAAAAYGRTDTSSENFDLFLDHDGNGIEDILDQWTSGQVSFADLRAAAVKAPLREQAKAGPAGDAGALRPGQIPPAQGDWQQGNLRLICLGVRPGDMQKARDAAAAAGTGKVLHALERFGGVTVLAVDAPGLRALLANPLPGRIMLDRDGVPALVNNREMVGATRAETGTWKLGNDWSRTVAILDSGCDTAHGDLGDSGDDDIDGPAPAVGDARDWFPADSGWPLFEGYKVVGWHDVTDDFPQAAGPWDYHYHGTALASVVAGSGAVEAEYRGMASGGRLTVVKYYDFDETWHAWAGDFLAACAWTLDHREIYRIGTVLTAVNWDVDAGISTAMGDLVAAGMLPVAAMGNYGLGAEGPGYPAAVADVLTSGAVDGSGALSSFSGRGLTVAGKPDLLAPGGGLLIGGGRIMAADNEPNDSYSGRFGTSLAAAHLAGAAHLLGEALLDNGVILPANRQTVQTLSAMLKLTAAPVLEAENAAGTGHDPLPYPDGPDASRGWGLLRIDAAVEGMLRPLKPGADQLDTLTLDWDKPVVARRLMTSPGVRYLIEAVPSGNLDVELVVADPAWLDEPANYPRVRYADANGRGTSEFTYLRPDAGSWLCLVVKRKSGQGTLALKIREADTFSAQGTAGKLPGLGTGAPNSGNLAGLSGPSLVIPSRVTVDLGARSLTVLDSHGDFRPGWPVYVFPHSSSQGGLTQPLVWDLDTVAGDEIVVASDFGSIYFFAANGSYSEVALTLNRSLTRPVGLETAAGRRVAVVDKLGNARLWSHGPVLVAQTALGHNLPLAPAAGQLVAGDGESLVVAFADGYLMALDGDLGILPGWPVDLGSSLTSAPTLCDLDRDGLHEIIQPVLDGITGQLTMRVLTGQGTAGPGDGTVLPTPEGGPWLSLAPAVVAGGYGTGDLRVSLAGLASNGLFGDQASWVLGMASLTAAGEAEVATIPGFRVKASTSQGNLTMNRVLLPAPVAWNFQGGGGTDLNILASVNWSEILIGFTSLPGSCSGWYGTVDDRDPLARRQPLNAGGGDGAMSASAGAMIVPLDGVVDLKVDVLDDRIGIMPVPILKTSATAWTAARGDGRNSGAYPLFRPVSSTPAAGLGPRGLVVYPNPGGGRFHFRVAGQEPGAKFEVEIFDLRGRRLQVVSGADGTGVIGWDGTDRRGRPLAAGTYLAVARVGGTLLKTRVVLTR